MCSENSHERRVSNIKPEKLGNPIQGSKAMVDDDGAPMFAFQDLDYIPHGFGGSTAPYIETPAATMRAAATLMGLGLSVGREVASTHQGAVPTVVCDLGCGDGYFLNGLLGHLNSLNNSAHGVGIDYNAELIKMAVIQSDLEGVSARWLIYNFNEDRDDLASQLIINHQVTHVFVYLVPKQLAMQTVRGILTRLCESGVVVCCHKFYPGYLTPVRRDILMELVVYDRTS